METMTTVAERGGPATDLTEVLVLADPADPVAADPAVLAERLARLSGQELVVLAGCLRRELDSAEGEIVWWRATMGVERSLRCTRRSRAAGLASHEASAAVLRAADAAGVRATERDAVTMVARAASDVARALVAGRGSTRPPVVVVPAWQAVLAAVALAA